MSKNNQPLTDEQLAQYLDQEVPLQQLEADKLGDIPPFMKAQFDFANSPHGKQAKQDRRFKCGLRKGPNDEYRS